MTYVYLVERYYSEDTYLLGVFSTLEKAEACLAQAQAEEPALCYQTMRVEIDAPYDKVTWQCGDVINCGYAP